MRGIGNIGLAALSVVLFSLSGSAQSGIITTYAGSPFPADGAPAASVAIRGLSSVASDGSGGFYVVSNAYEFDLGYIRPPGISKVYRVGADGTIRLVAGSDTLGYSGDGGPAISAKLNHPGGIAVDTVGNLYIADTGNHRIRKVTPDGTISTVAGGGTNGLGDGGPATLASLSSPSAVAVDSVGNLYISDTGNYRIRKVAGGLVSTVAGKGTCCGPVGFPDGTNALAVEVAASAIAVDIAGNVYFVNLGLEVDKVTPFGVINRVDSVRPSTGVAVDGVGNLYIAANYRIRMLTPSGLISTVAGTGTKGYSGDEGPATSAQIDPGTVSADAAGNLYISGGLRVRKVTSDGLIHTVAGTGSCCYGGDGGPAISAQLSGGYLTDDGGPSTSGQLSVGSMAMDAAGNLYISGDYRIRKVSTSGVISTLAGNGTNGYSGDGGPATSAQLSAGSLAVDTSGNLYFSDYSNSRIRRVAANGIITTVAGNGTSGYSGDGGPATSAQIYPGGLAVDALGNLYISDYSHNRIRKVSANGVITAFAGNGARGYSGDGGPAISAQLSSPGSLAVDAAGNLYISDFDNHRVRKVDGSGVITTVVGNGTSVVSGNGGPATSSGLNGPGSLAVDYAGNLYIVDFREFSPPSFNPGASIRKVAGGVISTVASNSFAYIAADAVGNIYISGYICNCIWKVTYVGSILTSISPGSGLLGASAVVTLTGMNFNNGVTSVDAIPGITISNAIVVNSTTITATFTVNPGATPGPRSVTVTTSSAVSNVLTFTVKGLTLTGITPASGLWNTSTTMTLTGFNFADGMSVNAGPGISVTNIQVLSPNSASATFAIASGAATGLRYIRLTNSIETSDPVSFVVNAPQPSVAGITPAFGRQGSVVAVALTGTNFVPQMAVDAGPNIGMGPILVTSPTTASAVFAIGPQAVPATHNVVVTTSEGTSNAVAFSVFPRQQDFNGDGKGDLLWTNNYLTAGWIMDGTSHPVSGLLVTDPAWRVAATPDLNGDGKTDLVWYNPSTGQSTAWLLNGAYEVSGAALFTDPNWQVIASSDFNGDGKTDLLGYNPSTGQTGLWLMNGTTVLSAVTIQTDPAWRVAATGDLNGDGMTDILWYRAASGQTDVWLMNGTSRLSEAWLRTNPNSRIIATGDFDFDGKADLVWNNPVTGQTDVWLMSGTSSSYRTTERTDPHWKVTATADFNGDGDSDLLWYNATTGETAIWLMNGTTPSSESIVLTDPNWKAVATTDLNGDGMSDLLWTNAATGKTSAWLMNGTSFVNGAALVTDPFWGDSRLLFKTGLSRTVQPVRAGVFRNGLWAVDSNRNWQWDTGDRYVYLGLPGDIPISGDFDGDGSVEMGIFKNGVWSIDLNHNGFWDEGDTHVYLGQAGDLPVVGDFDGDGVDEMGVFRNAFWAIDTNHNGIWDAGDMYTYLGQAGDLPVVGDFNRDGRDEIGIFRNGYWEIHTYRNGHWMIDRIAYLGQAGDLPVVGDFNRDGFDEMGIFRNGFWAIDLNGDQVWEQNDGYYGLGQSGDTPVILR